VASVPGTTFVGCADAVPSMFLVDCVVALGVVTRVVLIFGVCVPGALKRNFLLFRN